LDSNICCKYGHLQCTHVFGKSCKEFEQGIEDSSSLSFFELSHPKKHKENSMFYYTSKRACASSSGNCLLFGIGSIRAYFVYYYPANLTGLLFSQAN